jgi:hypothetical protein
VEKSDQKGIPIYLDPISRKIVTAGESDEGAITWYPSLPTSKRLWACFEIILDINGLLEDVATKNSGKRKRRAKVIAGQVHSLAKAINEL